MIGGLKLALKRDIQQQQAAEELEKSQTEAADSEEPAPAADTQEE